MNQTLNKLAVLLCAAAALSACDEGKYNDLECDSSEYQDECLDSLHFMTCYNNRLAVITCDEGFYCEETASGKATCKNPYLTDDTATPSCALNGAVQCSGNIVQTCTDGQWINASEPCANGCTNGVCVAPTPEPECSETNPCADPGKTCQDGTCVDKVPEPECSNDRPCEDASKQCIDGQCVDKAPDPECSDTKPCEDTSKQCVEGTCVEISESVCSEENPCPEEESCVYGECKPMTACESNADCTEFNMLCNDAKCTFAQDVACAQNSDCGTGFFCDIDKCLADGACSMSHTCPDTKICHNGHCQDELHDACSKTNPCPDAAQTCIQGKCITCQCTGENETCDAEGNCVSTIHSELKNITEGDVCEYTPEFGFCEGNIRFSCTKTVDEAEYHVHATDCGASICTESLTEDLGCHEACTVKGDFYGECLQQYYEITNTFISYAFKTECTESADGRLIWTFTEGYETCAASCTNGSCDFVPNNFGQSCQPASFTDRCIDQWAMTCNFDETTATGSIWGEDCAHYAEGDRQYTCALDAEDGVSDCVLDCTQEGDIIHVCHKYPNYLTTYSDERICAKTSDGKLGYFLTNYTTCGESGCDETTGLCKD